MITMTQNSRQVQVDAAFRQRSAVRLGAFSRPEVRLVAPIGAHQGTGLSSVRLVEGGIESPRISKNLSSATYVPTTQRPVPGDTAWSPPVL